MEGNFSDVPNFDVSNRHSDDDEFVRDLKKSLRFDNFDGKKRNMYYYGVDEDEEDGYVTEALLVRMGYGKTKTKKRPAMTPAPGKELEEKEEDVITKESLNQIQIGRPPKHGPPAAPIPADNLKSAMKGSGRKEKSPGYKEWKVTWTEGVFDQIRVETETHSQSQSQRSRQKWGKVKNKSGGKDKERKGGAKGKKFSGSNRKICIHALNGDDCFWSLFR